MPVTPYPPINTDVSDPPNRGQEQAVFSPKMDAFLAAFQPLKVEQNALGDWMNSAADQVETWANGAETAATASEASRQAADAASNYKGEWSALTGALNKPATVSNNGAFWALVNNLANVALSEPEPGNADWVFVSGTRWVTPYTASATLAANSLCSATVTAATAQFTLGTFVANDFFVLAVSPATTQTIRVLNPSYTIRGKRRTVNAGDDITMRPGSILHLRAVSSSVLEVYK